jgi:membrane protease YdiL (CAAX protease family)
MKYKFVVEEVNPEKKVIKWTIMIVGLHLIYLAFNFLGGILLTFYGANVMFLVTFIAGLFSFGILLISFNSMFPKVPGKKKMISIREGFRKYPIFGTFILLLLYAGFLFLPILIELPLIFIVDIFVDIPFIALLFVDFFVTFGVMALFWLLVVPRSLDLPEGKQHLKEYIKTIGLKFDNKIVRNILLGIGCSIIFFISTYITANLFGHYTFDLDVIFGTPGSSIALFGWFFFIIMLIPGIWEEVAFRGVITKLNSRRYSKRTTLIIVSVLFGLFHFVNLLTGNDLIGTILQVIYASLLGFLFGYMFIKTKSLIPSIIAHYLIDSVGQLFMFVSFENMSQFIFFAVIGIGIVPTLFGMLLVKLVVKEKDERIDLIN